MINSEAEKRKVAEQDLAWAGELDPQVSAALSILANPADPNTMYSDMTQVAAGYAQAFSYETTN